MVIEHVVFDITPGKEEDFLRHCEAHRAMFAAIAGCGGLTFGRGVENPSKMLFMLKWDSVAAHNMAREAGAFGTFGQGVGAFIAGPPSMEHFDIG